MSEVSRLFGWCQGPEGALLHCESCRSSYVGANGVTYHCTHVCHGVAGGESRYDKGAVSTANEVAPAAAAKPPRDLTASRTRSDPA